MWQVAYKQLRTVYQRVQVRMSPGRVRIPLTSSLFGPQTPLTKTTVCPAAAFWEQLSVFLALPVRGRRRFRKLKRASRLKLLLVLEVELLLLVGAGALSSSPSAPSARSPAAQEKVSGYCFIQGHDGHQLFKTKFLSFNGLRYILNVSLF